jgi:hypothetical protein
MFQPREIVYGVVKDIDPPKNKYIVTIYRDEELNIIACFTTSQQRVGYVFDKGKIIGINPEDGTEFSFPLRTIITFDYGVIEGVLEQLTERFENPKVVCKLSEKEYIDLVYAMYRSNHTKAGHKKILEKILIDKFK